MHARLAALLCLLGVLAGLVPPRLGYICAGMGGVRLAHPCCPAEPAVAGAPADPDPVSRLVARCCEEVTGLAVVAPAEPPGGHRDLIRYLVRHLVQQGAPASPFALAPPSALVHPTALQHRARPLPARPPDRAAVLRI